MRRTKALSIYPPPELRSKLETIASDKGRSMNQQIVRFLKGCVARHDERRLNRRVVASTVVSN